VTRLAIIAVCASAFAGPAIAQRLGGIGGLPGMPLGPTLQNTTGTLRDTTNGLGSTVNDVTRDAVGRPTLRRAMDKDANGATVVRGEILALSPSDASLAIAKGLKFEILRQDTLESLGLTVAVLRIPDDMSATEALTALRQADARGAYDYNHIYDPSGARDSNSAPTSITSSVDVVSLKIGMIDAGIDRRHRAFDGATIVAKNLAGDGNGVPTAHGTEVASLLIGKDDDFRGALDGATLYAADVYGGNAAGGAVDDIARALAWQSANGVPVVNISLAGPPNAILQAAVAAFVKRGHVLVAAVGNDGPASAVAYPAAYPGVVAVTSVDRDHKIQLDANRGPSVAFAALGVDVHVAGPKNGYATVTGTSFASPIVTARFALLVQRPDAAEVARAWSTLEHATVRLGAGVRDPEFGYGLLDPPPGAEQTTAMH
jgi:hypothetical protein